MMHATHAEPRIHLTLSRYSFQLPCAIPMMRRTSVLIAVPVTITSKMIVTKKPVLSRRKLNIVRLVTFPSARPFSDARAVQCSHNLVRDGPYQLFHIYPTGRPTVARGRGCAGFAAEGVRLRHEISVGFVKAAVATDGIALVVETNVVVAQPLFQLQQLARLLLVEVIDASQLFSENENTTISVDNLRVPVGFLQVRPKRERAVIGQDDRVAILGEGHDGIGELLAAGRLVDGERHFTEENFHFGQNALGDRLMCDGKRGSVRWMTVNAGLHVGPLFVNRQVQQHFTRTLADAGQLLAFDVHLADVFRLEKALGHHRRRAKKFAFVQTHGDVAVIGRCEAFRIDTPANLTDLFLQLILVHNSFSIVDYNRIQKARTVGIYELFLWEKGCRCLRAFAEANASADAGAEIVVNHHILPIGSSIIPQRGQTIRHANNPARSHHTWMHARECDVANYLSDAHGRPSPVRCKRYSADNSLPGNTIAAIPCTRNRCDLPSPRSASSLPFVPAPAPLASLSRQRQPAPLAPYWQCSKRGKHRDRTTPPFGTARSADTPPHSESNRTSRPRTPSAIAANVHFGSRRAGRFAASSRADLPRHSPIQPQFARCRSSVCQAHHEPPRRRVLRPDHRPRLGPIVAHNHAITGTRAKSINR